MSSECEPIRQTQGLSISERQIRQVLTPRCWSGLPHVSERENVKQATIEKLDQDKVDFINNQIQTSLSNKSRLIYKTTRRTHVLDSKNNIYYSLDQNDLIIAKIQSTKTTNISVYCGQLNAKLSLSEYLAFFNIQVNENNFVQGFYHQDLNSVPLIFSISKNSQKAKLILAKSPYDENSLIIGPKLS